MRRNEPEGFQSRRRELEVVSAVAFECEPTPDADSEAAWQDDRTGDSRESLGRQHDASLQGPCRYFLRVIRLNAAGGMGSSSIDPDILQLTSLLRPRRETAAAARRFAVATAAAFAPGSLSEMRSELPASLSLHVAITMLGRRSCNSAAPQKIASQIDDGATATVELLDDGVGGVFIGTTPQTA